MTGSPDLIYMESALLCAALAAVTDLRSRRIPNWLTGSGILAGLALHLGLGGVRDSGSALLAGLIAGGIFLLFFLAGGMGAGDVKLMAAIGCLGGLHSVRSLLLLTAILGAVAAIVAALASGRLAETVRNVRMLLAHHSEHGLGTPHAELNVRNNTMLRLPYAIPIAGACLLTLGLTLHGGTGL